MFETVPTADLWEEEPREPAVDLGCGPGPLALAMAAGLDPETMSPEAQLDLIGLVERSITVAQALRSQLIAAYADGCPHDEPTTWDEQQDLDWHREQLAAVCQTSPHEADVRCRTALALRDRLPATAAAVRAGSLPWAQAVVLARESDGLDPAASDVVERTVLADPRAVSVRQVRDATRAAVEVVRPRAADERVRDAYATRSLQFWPHDDGSTDLFARLTTDSAIAVAAALEPLAGPAGPDDERTAEQRRADALVALATEDRGAARGARPASVTLLARVDPDRPLAGGLSGGLLAGGHLGASPIAPETLRRLTCEAMIAVAAVSPDGSVGPASRRRRFPDAELRRRLEARDQRCLFPGCPVAARRCHAHHLQHWSQGGPTAEHNLVLVCHRHHQAVHEGGWSLRGPATRLRWRDRHGREYATPVATASLPAWPCAPPTDVRATLGPPGSEGLESPPF